MKTQRNVISMKTLSILLVLGFLCCSSTVFGQKSSIPAAFVDVGMGARPAGMGGAYSGLADDINALTWNPAGLINLTEKEAQFTNAKIFGLITYNTLSFGMPLKINETPQAAGLSLLYSGDESYREMTVTAGYARKVGPVSIGANLKYRYASFGKNTLETGVFTPEEYQEGLLNQVRGSANGLGFDLGVLYQFNEKIRMGLMLRDIYSPVSWNSESDSKLAQGKYTETVPFETIVGTSYKVFDELTITADLQPALTKDVSNMIRGGAELKVFKFLFVRAGLQNMINDQNDERFVFGVGLNIGVKKSTIHFDYTYLLEQLANSNRLTISFSF